ncbi:MAG: winged helix-turn-helix domain-containing protein [Dokdonella sp.]
MSEDRIVRLDDLQIDLDRQRVERGGRALDVNGLSFRLLACLLERGDRVVGFDELIEAVWTPAVVGEETVTQRVKLLRQALGDDGRRPRYIRSVRGQGYQLCSMPQRAGPIGDGAAAPAQPGPGARWLTHVGIVVALVGIVASLLYPGARDSSPDGEAVKPAPPESTLQRAYHYSRIGQDANNERAITLFEAALSEDADNVDARIGLSRALSARMCLYNRGVDSIARAEALAREVLAGNADDARAHDALAYAFDCRGLIDQAIAEYERAVALDPVGRFDSRSSAAYLYMVRGRLFDALQANIAVAAKRDQLRFYDIQLARNLELLGFTAIAEQRYERSFRLYPDSIYSNVAWPRSLFLQGRLAEAGTAVAQALERPTHPELHILEGELALLRGAHAGAIQAFDRAHALRPQTSWPDSLRHIYATAPADVAWLQQQAATIDAQIAAGEHSPDMHLEKALLEQALGRRDQAFADLDAAIAAGFSDRAYLQVSPLFRGFAGDPRMADAIDRIGRHVASERARVLAADWLPEDLFSAVKASP